MSVNRRSKLLSIWPKVIFINKDEEEDKIMVTFFFFRKVGHIFSVITLLVEE